MNKSEALARLDAAAAALDDVAAYVLALPDDAPAPTPTIADLTVTPSTLPHGGGRVTINATVAHATTVRLDGSVVGLPVERDVTASRAFVLVADGPGGSATASVAVDVAAAPPVADVRPVVKTLGALTNVLVAPGYYYGDRYDRFQSPLIVKGERVTLKVTTRNLAAGGSRIAFGFAAPLSLLLDGVAVATATTVATANEVLFDVPLAGLSGWYRTSVAGAPDGWDVLDYAVYVDAGAAPTTMPVIIASYGLMHPVAGTPYVHQSAMVPAVYQPTTLPLVPRECPSFTDLPARDKLVQTQLAICRQDDKYRPVKSGALLHTCNRQDYFWSDVTEKRPWFHMLDGPRGRGAVVCPTHLEVGSAAPASIGLVGNVYFCDPQRFGKVRANGEVVTLAGYRHRSPPTQWNEPAQDVALVGNWSAIPAERRGFRELWGMAWDSRTFATDESAAPIPSERNLKPHITGVRCFLTDMLNGRVVSLKFSPTSHAEPPLVSEFWLGAEPWDVVEVAPGRLAVSERAANRVVIIDIDTAAIVDSFAAAEVSGLFFQDGWLYYGSRSAKAVRKRNLSTGVDVFAVNLAPFVDNNSMYVKIALSDGTFGPRGMIGVVTWSNNGYGYPHLFRPTGQEIGGWLWAGTARPGPAWIGQGDAAPGYPTAVAFGFGRMVCGTVQEGLMMMSKALTTDAAIPAAYYVGAKQWHARGYHLTHGHRGFGFYGLPLPWGESPEIDVFLTHNGHTRIA